MVQDRLLLVEATGLEPTTFWSLTKRATKLRYASICYVVLANNITIISILQRLVKRFLSLFKLFLKNFRDISFYEFDNLCEEYARRENHKERHYAYR